MKVTALAGGVGAGKFLRGLVRVVDPQDVTVIVNTGDDVTIHGLHVSPDIDSVLYALAGLHDTERGWGRADETFRSTGELRDRFGAPDAWFNLGDLDLATHLFRTNFLNRGATLAGVTGLLAKRLGIASTVLPMSDDRVETRIEGLHEDGRDVELHFQEYWVKEQARARVKRVGYEGAAAARPAPGVLEALAGADVVVVCPSNPVASIAPILAVPGIRETVSARRPRVVGVSPIVGGAPLRGMADKLMPAIGLEVTAAGAARAYQGLLGAWVIDGRDRALAPGIERELGVRVGITDTIMNDDEKAAALARFSLEMVS